MDQFAVGQKVIVRCHLDVGPFPDQYLATMFMEQGNVSGLVKVKELLRVKGSEGYVQAEVLEVTEQTLTLRLPDTMSGNFFTRSGIASLPLDWARGNVEPADAG